MPLSLSPYAKSVKGTEYVTCNSACDSEVEQGRIWHFNRVNRAEAKLENLLPKKKSCDHLITMIMVVVHVCSFANKRHGKCAQKIVFVRRDSHQQALGKRTQKL